MRLRFSHTLVGTTLSVAAAVLVTAQAMSMPRKPYKARDIVATDAHVRAQLAGVCQMYPADCRFNADGSVERIVGRRIEPGADRAVIAHFRTAVGTVTDSGWGETPASNASK